MASERDSSNKENFKKENYAFNKSKKKLVIDPSLTYYISSSDNPTTPLVVVVLNGENYKT